MKIRFVLLGYELASINVDLPPAGAVEDVPVVDKAIEAISDWWVRRMLKKHTAHAA